jgi:hypothetical protein
MRLVDEIETEPILGFLLRLDDAATVNQISDRVRDSIGETKN